MAAATLSNTVKAHWKTANSSVSCPGDSLTYGVGDQKKQGGYVSQIKTKLEAKNNVKVKTANFGVSGNRSDQIEKRLKTQTKFQTKLKNADVIVMTVGGNDLFQKLQQEMFVSSTQTVNQDMAKALTTYQTKLTSLMHEIRHYNSKSPIFLYSIYNPVYVYFANVSLISKSVAQLNQVDQSVIKADGNTYFVDINHALSDGQYTTKAKRQKLLDKTKKVNQSSLDLSQYNEVLNGLGKAPMFSISNADFPRTTRATALWRITCIALWWTTRNNGKIRVSD